MICIIPARGGSKRLKGKNLYTLDGEFIINKVISIAKESMLFSEIIVSTDSEQIRDIVIGARVSMRPDKISGDIAEDEVLKWTAEEYWANTICRIYPFAVLLTPERLRKGFLEFKSGKYDNVHECQKYAHNPIRAFSLNGGYYDKSIISMPSEFLGSWYHDAGTYMFTGIEALNKPLGERNIKWMPVKEWEAQDLDDADDWEVLRMKYEWGRP